MDSPLSEFRVIASNKVTPGYCGQIARAAAAALEVLERWSAGRGLAVKLREAIRALQLVADADSFGETPTALLTTVDAIALAGDFFQIAQCLGPEVLPSVGAEIAQALAVGKSGTAKSRRAVEFQSQYWVGMLLASTRLEPRVLRPDHKGKQPDFLVDIGVADVAIEVKRPESTNSMIDALDRAAGQIRAFGKPGIIFLDLSDCLFAPVARLRSIERRQPIVSLARERFFGLCPRIEGRPHAYRHSDKYHRVVAVVPFARIHAWSYNPELLPTGEVWIKPAFLPTACAGLLAHEYPRVERLLLHGMEVVTGSDPSRAS